MIPFLREAWPLLLLVGYAVVMPLAVEVIRSRRDRCESQSAYQDEMIDPEDLVQYLREQASELSTNGVHKEVSK